MECVCFALDNLVIFIPVAHFMTFWNLLIHDHDTPHYNCWFFIFHTSKFDDMSCEAFFSKWST